MSALTGGQAKFASVFSRETGLNPQVVGAWLLAEQSGPAARYYEGKGYNNWLNIANTDSGPKGGANSAVWKNPETAGKASAEWIRGQGQIAKEYGKPASSITAILGSHGQAPHRQIQAIANSGWASNGYNHGETLSQLLGQVGNIPTAGPGPLPGVTRQGAIASVTGTAPGFNTQGYQQAAQHAAGERAAASLFTEPGSELIRSALEKAGTPPSATSFSTPGTQVSGIGKTTASGSSVPSTTGYVHPLPSGFVQGRTDQGVDFSATPGDPIRAIGNGRVLGVESNWFQGQPFVYYELTDGPKAGNVVYVAEQIAPNVRPGQAVSAGQQIGTYAKSGTGIETGWATKTGQTRAMATSGYTEGQQTKAGKEFEAFLKGLR